MSYAGQLVFKYMERVKGGVVDEIVTAFTELHKRHVLHCDAELRNVLYDLRIGRCTIVDLERAKVRPRQPLLFSFPFDGHSVATKPSCWFLEKPIFFKSVSRIYVTQTSALGRTTAGHPWDARGTRRVRKGGQSQQKRAARSDALECRQRVTKHLSRRATLGWSSTLISIQ